MEVSQSTNKGANLSAFGKVRGMLGPKRRLIAPFIVAAVLMIAVALFLLISDNLITTVADELDFPWDQNPSVPGVIMPGSDDRINPEDDLPELQDVFTVRGARDTTYLRCFAASYYDGQFWLKDPSSQPQKYEGQQLTCDVSGYSSSTSDNITIAPLVDIAPGYIPTSLYTTVVDSEDPLLLYPQSSVFYLSETSNNPYSFSTTHHEFEQEVLESAEVLDDVKYLQLPGNITDRTRALAEEITVGYDNPHDKAKAIERYLLTGYQYTTDFLKSPDNLESTDWFLFEDKKGIHTHFSSAFVVLARCAGLPTRLVSGYFIQAQIAQQTVNTIQFVCTIEMGYKELGWIGFNNSLGVEGTGAAIETLTYIDGISDTPEYDVENPYAAVIEKDKPFHVSGRVETEDGFSVIGMPVRIWLASADGPKPDFPGGWPDIPALWVGTGVVTEDGYSIECDVPVSLVAGQWRVITQSVGLTPFYLPSDSDPEITIKAQSQFGDVIVPDTVNVGEAVVFTGNLTDSEDVDIPISFEPIEVTITNLDDIEDVQVVPGSTFEDGSFIVPYIFDEQGDFSVTISFVGSTYYYAAEDVISNTHVSWNTHLTLDMLEEVKEGSSINISGRLTTAVYGVSTGTPLAGRTVGIYLSDTLIRQDATDANGNYSIDYLFDDSGQYTIEVQYVGENSHTELIIDEETGEVIATPTVWGGDLYYKSSQVNQGIKVYGPPTITVDINAEKDVYDPVADNTITMDISLIDEFGSPLEDAEVYLDTQRPDGSDATAGPFQTNDEGIIRLFFRGRQVGVYNITTVFDETALFHGMDTSVDVTVWMPTAITMNDFSAFTNIKEGTMITISGSLLDYWGDALAAGTTVSIMNGDEVLTTTTTGAAGDYSVDYYFEDSGDYQVYASYAVDDVNYYRASQSEPHQAVRVYGPPTLDLTVPARQDLDAQPVPIQGHLYDEFGNDLPGEIVIIQFSDGSVDVPVTTGFSGRFSLSHTFAVMGDYTITAVFHETSLYPQANATADITIMMPTTLTFGITPAVTLGSPVTISGTLQDVYSGALAGQTITLLDGATPIDTVVTLGDGSFTCDHTFAESGVHEVTAQFAEIDYYKSSQGTVITTVYGPPTLELTVPDKADEDEPATISGHMYDEFGDNLTGYTVTIQFSNGSPDVAVATDGDGRFSLEHTFDDFGDYTVTASFAGAGLYPPAAYATSDIRIMIPTTLMLDMPDYSMIDTWVLIEAYLTETGSDDSVIGQAIELYDGITLIDTSVTVGADANHVAGQGRQAHFEPEKQTQRRAVPPVAGRAGLPL